MTLSERIATLFPGLDLEQPGSVEPLLQQYPYFETPYLLAVLQAGTHAPARSKHQAALVTGNNKWIPYLLYTQRTDTTASDEEEALAGIEETSTSGETETVIHDEAVFTSAAEKEIDILETAWPETSGSNALEKEESPAITPTIPHLPSNEQEQSLSSSQTIHEPVSIETTTGDDTLETETIIDPAPLPAADVLPPVTETAEESKTATTVSAGTEELPIAIEPYHTIDYFASQGIKHQPETQPTDRLSQQMRSFTDWLKSMKKIAPGQEKEVPESVQVDQLAEKSLSGGEILTETMADVLLKQGRVGEAIEILQKLSLHNTDKSAYFAARITHLKTI